MALIPSAPLPLGTRLPDATLSDAVSGAVVGLHDLLANRRALVVLVLANRCPHVQLIGPEIGALAADYAGRAVGFAAVSAGDAPASMAEAAREWGLGCPSLHDEHQALARALAAVRTPESYVFDADGLLVYRGAFDDARPGNGVGPSGTHVREALEALLHGRPGIPDDEQRPSVGCEIQWRALVPD